MNKYTVSIDEKLYYLAKEIEADSKEKAIEKYMNAWEKGDIVVNESEIVEVRAEKMD